MPSWNCSKQDLQSLIDECLSGLRPRPRITGSEWADQFRIIPPGTTPEPGLWRTSRVPYLREPLDAATALDVERVVIMAASQVAKSELLINTLCFYIEREPASIMMVQPTVEAAEAFSKERIDPTLQATPAVRERMQAAADPERGRSRKSNSTIRMKNFLGGYLAMVGSNSPSGLASRPIRVLLCDEIDRFGMTQEGDPLKLAIQRTTNFANRKIVLVSTPTTETRVNGPTIFSEYMKSDQRVFKVMCPHCSQRFVMKWEHVKWDKDADDSLIEESVRMECPHCGKKVRGNGKADPYLLESGIWEPQNPESRIRGYHLSSLCSPWVQLLDLVIEWRDAHRSRSGLQEFINLKLGEAWEEHRAVTSAEALMARCEDYPGDGIPDEVLIITAGVDVQQDRLECSLYGWGLGFECWLLDHKVIFGDPFRKDVWQELDNTLIRQEFKTVSGSRRAMVGALVDSGDGQMTSRVYEYTRPRERYRIVSCKGRGGEMVPFVNRPSRAGEAQALLYTLGVDAGKRRVYSRLANSDPGPEYIHFPRGRTSVDLEFFEQLLSENQKRERDKLGREHLRWVQLRERNEALDCLVYATAAVEIVNPDFDRLAVMLKVNK